MSDRRESWRHCQCHPLKFCPQTYARKTRSPSLAHALRTSNKAQQTPLLVSAFKQRSFKIKISTGPTQPRQSASVRRACPAPLVFPRLPRSSLDGIIRHGTTHCRARACLFPRLECVVNLYVCACAHLQMSALLRAWQHTARSSESPRAALDLNFGKRARPASHVSTTQRRY